MPFQKTFLEAVAVGNCSAEPLRLAAASGGTSAFKVQILRM